MQDTLSTQEQQNALEVLGEPSSAGIENNAKIVYKPRSDIDVWDALKTNEIPSELKEQLQLVDFYSDNIKQKVEAIIKRIFEKNNLSSTISFPRIVISACDHDNASMMAAAKPPILMLNKGLLKNAQSEDELAGVIAHEFGHLLLYAQTGLTKNSFIKSIDQSNRRNFSMS
jgi:predicted Zn-dependent protease